MLHASTSVALSVMADKIVSQYVSQATINPSPVGMSRANVSARGASSTVAMLETIPSFLLRNFRLQVIQLLRQFRWPITWMISKFLSAHKDSPRWITIMITSMPSQTLWCKAWYSFWSIKEVRKMFGFYNASLVQSKQKAIGGTSLVAESVITLNTGRLFYFSEKTLTGFPMKWWSVGSRTGSSRSNHFSKI